MIVFQPISETYEPNVCIIIYSKAMQKPLIATNSNRFESRFVSLMVSNFQVFDVSSEFLFFSSLFICKSGTGFLEHGDRTHDRIESLMSTFHAGCQLFFVCVCVCVFPLISFLSFFFYFIFLLLLLLLFVSNRLLLSFSFVRRKRRGGGTRGRGLGRHVVTGAFRG